MVQGEWGIDFHAPETECTASFIDLSNVARGYRQVEAMKKYKIE